MEHEFTDTYNAFLRSMCSYWAPGQDEYLSGEIIQQWSVRQGFRREKSTLEAEIMKREAVLGDLLYRKKRELCKPGRNGRWCEWLRQRKIARSTADRLILEHAEFFGLQDGLNQRAGSEPNDGTISQAAYRTCDRLEHTLRSPGARMKFMRCLGDLLGFEVDYGERDSVRLSFPLPQEETTDVAPNIIEVLGDGTIRPVNYELPDDGEESPFL
jgi:hypothetical protein